MKAIKAVGTFILKDLINRYSSFLLLAIKPLIILFIILDI